MMRTIEMTVSPTGQIRMEAHGFVGSSCRDATQALERALGQVTGEALTAEFYQVLPEPAREREPS